MNHRSVLDGLQLLWFCLLLCLLSLPQHWQCMQLKLISVFIQSVNRTVDERDTRQCEKVLTIIILFLKNSFLSNSKANKKVNIQVHSSTFHWIFYWKKQCFVIRCAWLVEMIKWFELKLLQTDERKKVWETLTHLNSIPVVCFFFVLSPGHAGSKWSRNVDKFHSNGGIACCVGVMHQLIQCYRHGLNFDWPDCLPATAKHIACSLQFIQLSNHYY